MSERAVIAAVEHKIRKKQARAEEYDPGEIVRLSEAAGAEPVSVVRASVSRVDPALYIGKGKVSETAKEAGENKADIAIFDCVLSPGQQGNLEDALGIRVVDRTQLILDIFAKRARTNEGKIQVELAQLNYLLPRLRGKGPEMSRLGGGIGTRGPGEMKLETDRRRLFRRIRKLNFEIERIRKHRALGRKERSRLLNIALIGYTNSGKSTLLNKLTGSNEISENRLFSTLDSTARRIMLPGNTPAVLIDTVGFIKGLPHNLVAAFRATLEEVGNADILLNVMDASAAMLEERMKTVADTLSDIGAADKITVSVLNKIDLLDPGSREIATNTFPDAVPVSARTGEGLDLLLTVLLRKAGSKRRRVFFRIPQGEAGIANRLFDKAGILEIKYSGDFIMIEAEAEESLLREFEKYTVGKI